MTPTIAICLAAWAACGVGTFLLSREDFRTVADPVVDPLFRGFLVSLGPIGLVVVGGIKADEACRRARDSRP